MVKEQIRTATTTYFQEKSDKVTKAIRPSKATQALAVEYQRVLDKVEKHNEEAKEQEGFAFTIENPRYNHNKVTTSLTNYASFRPTGYGSVSIAPELKEEADKKAQLINDYLLRLTLGQETVEGLQEFMKNLTK